jgi:hypothetical protein
MKKIKFEERVVCNMRVGLVRVVATNDGDFRLLLPSGAFATFSRKDAAALRTALAEYELAAQEASKLTFADLKPGEYFRLRGDIDKVVRLKPVAGNIFHRYPDATIPDSEPVVRLEVTIEVVE